MNVLRLDIPIKIAVACIALAVGAVGLSAPALTAAKAPGNFETKAKHAILMDADANLVFYEKEPDELMPPASMSKLMTLAVVFRELKAGRLKLDDEFKVSEHAWRTGGAPSGSSAMFAPLNSMIKVEDLIQGITVQSGNDACIILAEGISGSEEAFAQEMNKYAKEIGLTKSHFVNSTGPAGRRPRDDRARARDARQLPDQDLSRVLPLFRREGVQLRPVAVHSIAIRWSLNEISASTA